jgi:hypothetical protein
MNQPQPPEPGSPGRLPSRLVGLSWRGWLWTLGAALLLLVIFRAYLRPEILIDFVMRYCG